MKKDTIWTNFKIGVGAGLMISLVSLAGEVGKLLCKEGTTVCVYSPILEFSIIIILTLMLIYYDKKDK